jgi:hypothetical protein
MAREAGNDDLFDAMQIAFLERFEALVRADERNRTWTQEHWTEYERSIAAVEREACEKMCEEFARKWWKIHCDSNLHYSSTLRAHQDFCALQAAIRARGRA